ncbi:MAG: hypothetical protein IJZ70_04210 [Bacteroidales bacterium]|nr:hypothetical protein [Bacteroidales bacterium]
MKLINNILAVSCFLFASCSAIEDNSIEDMVPVPDPIVATIGDETRTSIGQNTDGAYKVLWSRNDRILIVTGNGKANQGTYITQDAGEPSASFITEDASKILDFSQGAIACYPVEEVYASSPDPDKELYLTIPDTQKYNKASFADNTMPMISDLTYSPEFRFRNAAGVLKLIISTELPDLAVSSITINTSEFISGECGYIPNTHKYFFDESMICNNHVILDCGDGVDIGAEPTPFHIVVPHQTYTTMSICVAMTDGSQQTFKMKSDKSLAVARSTVLNIPLKLTEVAPPAEPEVSVKFTNASFNSLSIAVDINNVSSYIYGFQTKESFMKDIESGYLPESLAYGVPHTSPMYYRGNIKGFQEEIEDILIEPGQSYVLWIVPYKPAGGYTLEDMTYAETMTKSFSSGSEIQVTINDLVIDQTSMTMTLNAPGAKWIYSILAPADILSQYRSETELIRLVLEPGGMGSFFESSKDILQKKFLKPSTKMTLLALAVEANGKYGPLLHEDFYTKDIPYNSLKVSIQEDLDYLKSSQKIKWDTGGGTPAEYRYIFKETDSYLWTNTLEGSVLTAQEKMVLEPTIYYINHTTDSSINVSGLTEGDEYILVVLAVDKDGSCSVADSWTFTY